jgi:glucan phosphoethanolaminetransferase (alkaline phosphatase superfamily)
MFVVFLTTGQFMRANFPDKDIIPQELRLLMRSRHIYILYCAFLHILLGVYLQVRPGWWQKLVQYAGSAVLIVSGILLVWAFVAETYTYAHFSEISRFGIYTSLAGVGLHLIGGVAGQNRER